jgi:hypothetical protein
MARQHAGTGNNGTPLWCTYDQENLRLYYDQAVGGNLVAIAISQDNFEDSNSYFCLLGIWDKDADTCWMSRQELIEIAEKQEPARQCIGLANDGTPLYGLYNQENLRLYYDQEVGGNLVAVAIIQDNDNFTRYFCLPGVWNQDFNTFCMSEEELLKIVG